MTSKVIKINNFMNMSNMFKKKLCFLVLFLKCKRKNPWKKNQVKIIPKQEKKISWVELRGRVEICLAASQRSIQHLYALASLHFLLRSLYWYMRWRTRMEFNIILKIGNTRYFEFFLFYFLCDMVFLVCFTVSWRKNLVSILKHIKTT